MNLCLWLKCFLKQLFCPIKDPPPTYDIAVNHVEYPIVVVSKDVPQDCLPTYDDVIKCIENKAKS